jgi:hypothetical protein
MPSAKRLRGTGLNGMARTPGESYGGSKLGLDADYLGCGAALGRHQGSAADAAAQAHRHKQHVRVGQFVKDLQGVGAYAGDQIRFVRRMDITQAFAVTDALAVLAGFVIVPAMLDQFGAERLNGGILVRVVVRRHNDDAAHAEQAAGVGQGLAMVAGRAADNAALLLLGRQARDEVDAAAHLEGGCGRVIFVLEVEATADPPGQRRPFVERRWFQITAYDRERRDDVGIGWGVHPFHLMSACAVRQDSIRSASLKLRL